jgi:cytochrome c
MSFFLGLAGPHARRTIRRNALVLMAGFAALAAHAAAPPEAERGAREFRACIACHSLAPGQHLTGPSLANLFGRRAGTAPGFQRYSEALRRSGVVWDERSLDAWLADPARFVPGNSPSISAPPNPNSGSARPLPVP